MSSGEARREPHVAFGDGADAGLRTRTRTSSCCSFSSSLRIASMEPRKSALRMTFSSAIFVSAKPFQRDRRAAWLTTASRSLSLRCSAIRAATARSGTTANGSSALGTSSRPVMPHRHARAGFLDRPAQVVVHLRGRGRRRRRTGSMSPRCSVPSRTSSVACTPSPFGQHSLRGRCPLAGLFGFALSSLQLGDDRELIEQLVDALAGGGAGLDERRVAAHVVGQHVEAVKLLLGLR